MEVVENISLKPYNTFGIDVPARYFAKFTSTTELQELIHRKTKHGERPLFILGGGSNILLTQPYNGLVAKNELPGIEAIGEDEEFVFVKAGAGENWHRFVQFCIAHNYAGAENLSLIPGNVGASPMQNIGAYGVEIKDIFHELEAMHIGEMKLQKFSLADCRFGYRESVFKHGLKGQYVITSVTFKLRKQPIFHVEYGAIRDELDRMHIQQLSIAAISQAVIYIRQSKLPDPKIIGNAGSFFKNPTIPTDQFEELQKKFPSIVGYPANDNETKVAAGWLIEQCGWKGFRRGDAGCHAKQALVLVNYGNATGKEIYNLSAEIVHSVKQKFSITLEREVNLF